MQAGTLGLTYKHSLSRRTECCQLTSMPPQEVGNVPQLAVQGLRLPLQPPSSCKGQTADLGGLYQNMHAEVRLEQLVPCPVTPQPSGLPCALTSTSIALDDSQADSLCV